MQAAAAPAPEAAAPVPNGIADSEDVAMEVVPCSLILPCLILYPGIGEHACCFQSLSAWTDTSCNNTPWKALKPSPGQWAQTECVTTGCKWGGRWCCKERKPRRRRGTRPSQGRTYSTSILSHAYVPLPQMHVHQSLLPKPYDESA